VTNLDNQYISIFQNVIPVAVHFRGHGFGLLCHRGHHGIPPAFSSPPNARPAAGGQWLTKNIQKLKSPKFDETTVLRL
jgi:hypothetical protein